MTTCISLTQTLKLLLMMRSIHYKPQIDNSRLFLSTLVLMLKMICRILGAVFIIDDYDFHLRFSKLQFKSISFDVNIK